MLTTTVVPMAILLRPGGKPETGYTGKKLCEMVKQHGC